MKFIRKLQELIQKHMEITHTFTKSIQNLIEKVYKKLAKPYKTS
jgi:predicted small metal-binding protein